MVRCVSAGGLRVLFGVLIGLMLIVPAIVSAQNAAKVVEVAVAGNANINTDTIKNVISLKPGDEHTEQAVEKDRASIMSLGYFSAVTKRVEEVAGGVKVTYEVTENPRITEVKILGSGPITTDKILAVMKTKSGQVLNSTTLDQDIDSIQALYRDQGYIAYPTEDIGVDPKTGVLTIPILVHTVESVEITGAKKTRPYVFLREMKTKPGAYFNVNVLKADIMRIVNLDILEEVKEYNILPGAEPGTVKIQIPVTEKKTGQVSVGFGYSSRQKLVGQARLSETNFRGKGQGANFLWEQGTSEAVGGSGSYELGYYEPWLDSHHTSLSVSAFDKIIYRFTSGVFGNSDLSNNTPYNERHKGADLTVSRPFSDTLRGYVGSRAENVDTDPALLQPYVVVGSGQANDDYKIVQEGNVVGGSLRTVHNTRDLDLDPAAGGYDGLSYEFGWVNGNRFGRIGTPGTIEDADGNDIPVINFTYPQIPVNGVYNKASVDFRRYFSRQGRKTNAKDKRTVLALRLRAGFGAGTIPFFEQFFVGGADSLRGYREDRFWGNRMLLMSAELRKPIAQAITGVVFVDFGDAWATPDYFLINTEGLTQSEGFQANFGTGVGMRVTTPIGNLRLDYAFGNEGARTHFSMGQAF